MTDVSKSVKLAGRLPGSTENNGMYSVVDDLLVKPKDRRLALIWYDVPRIVDDVETGDRVPTMRVLRVEPVGEAGEAAQAIQELVMQLAESRLGHTPLPFDQVDPDGIQELPEDDGDN